MKPEISVLTDPIPIGRDYFSEALKHAARNVRDVFRPPPAFMRSPYRGHFAVTRSLVEGLKRASVPATYNPGRLSQLGDTVIVLAGLSALRQAIDLKRRGEIKKLLAGPNLVSFPSDARHLVCAPEVDLCITPSAVTCRLYMDDCPELAGRCAPWAAGVDAAYWSPAGDTADRPLILFYEKPATGPTDEIERYVAFVKSRGHHTHRLQYGSYVRDEYRDLLRRSKLFVGFSAMESQGLAWTEAWAVNVPTLLWYTDRSTFNHPRFLGRTFQTSTAPHLTESTGRFFKDFNGFTSAFTEWESGNMSYKPRAWVLDNMTDEVCARRLCELAGVRPPLAAARPLRMQG